MTAFTDQAKAARVAARALALADRARKDQALNAMADALLEHTAMVLSANTADVEAAEDTGVAPSQIDRLRLTVDRVAGMAQGLRDLAGLPDPVGEVARQWTTTTGLRISQQRVPFGVVGIIYEARPNVTADAAGICLKSGNAALLRGSSSALRSNRVVVEALRAGLSASGIDPNSIQLVEGGREVTTEMMTARGLVDLLIPRGGAGLIEAVVTGSTVPVIETGTGNCHLYVDRDADLEVAARITINAKAQRPSVCNALETVLVHHDVARDYWQALAPLLAEAGVTVHGDKATLTLVPGAVPATDAEYDAEYLSLDLAARVVDDMDEAIEHIQTHSSGHSETIVTTDQAAAAEFARRIDAAAVLVNASSRFVDGGEFGFGAEIGISTQKLHARGPMGLAELTSTKYVVVGQGQTRS
ncbi:glutamate-5-semialdehyde dehydrogenase [Aestuariimicrobium sp. T2.26MG-19.2B]|uniref:glutamate-5-semialdehyde dehydrogenase n=1 Tax=Aestuariimicrobium sp. T2.26MG-19.2B TaxID=3040679 RepID=UPI0024774B9F|nr:glutamate-5-semialdehyde dehydrogenase [Aestuariimicrobium sp. T2.26MG-19.2B]CAI9411453.1 Gamma-glutamyl phosphate reductase [Aestuariimicrobium sp. T2.26MG-19.2B]